MTIKELKRLLEYFEDDKDIIVWNPVTKHLDEVANLSENSGHLQLNILDYESQIDCPECQEVI